MSLTLIKAIFNHFDLLAKAVLKTGINTGMSGLSPAFSLPGLELDLVLGLWSWTFHL